MSTMQAENPPSSLVFHLTSSSTGKKILMAATGLILFGHVFGQMARNLQIFIWFVIVPQVRIPNNDRLSEKPDFIQRHPEPDEG